MREQARAAGFSLMELLIAVAVLLTGIVAVAQLVPVVLTSNLKARLDSTSLLLAQIQMEQFMNQSMSAGNPAAGGTYVYSDGFMPIYTAGGLTRTMALGAATNPLLVAAAAADPAATTAGADLISLTGQEPLINWGEASPPANYFKTLQLGNRCFQIRWNVMTFFHNFNGYVRPIAKRYVISARSVLSCDDTTAFQALPPANVRAIVSWTNQ